MNESEEAEEVALYLLFTLDEVDEIIRACSKRSMTPGEFIKVAVRELLDY